MDGAEEPKRFLGARGTSQLPLGVTPRSMATYGAHLHYQQDISNLDCVSTADFEELKEAVAVDARNLDVAWIILCSMCLPRAASLQRG